ncbi:hypothetical protein Tel_04530 [Candidatus Tenderia electrophaga]|jgi:hypothetical protein|uniref:PEP-CTERM protein-sorting domain-containing protein n=1 Tax=Candidatus Tenderia electrophaga TaxID=1748243 RepID=A0A0S2TBE0_9GAMM|nr:hypothetical protein Tel_04530 [Candidatus Tenderia electrophaga]
MWIRSICLAAVLPLFSVSVAEATVISTYTDHAAWRTALGGAAISAEGFDGSASSFDAGSSGNAAGSVNVDVIGGVGDPGPTGLTGGGFLQGEVDSSPIGTDDGIGLTIHHVPATGVGLLGLQNDSATSPAGLNLVEIGLQIGAEAFLVSDLLGLTDSASSGGSLGNTPSAAAVPFLGFILDIPLDSFSIVHGDRVYAGGVSGTSEEFYLDGLTFATAVNTSQVPAPAPGLLLLAGIAALRLARRR